MTSNVRTVASLACAAALLWPASAAWSGQGGQQRQYDQQRQQQQSRQQARIHTVRGELLDVRELDLRQDRQPHLLAKVRTDRGRTVVIDLGRAEDVRRQNIRFRRNQTLEAQGMEGRINDRPVLVAQRFRPEGRQVVQLDRRQEMQQMSQRRGQPQEARDPQQQARSQKSRYQRAARTHADRAQHVVRGEVVETRRIQLRGMRDEHTLAKVRQDDGRIAIVDLGARDALQGLSFEKGERIAVRGTAGRISNRPVLVAREVAQMAYLDRTDFLGGQQGQQKQQGQQGQQQGQQQQGQSGGSR